MKVGLDLDGTVQGGSAAGGSAAAGYQTAEEIAAAAEAEVLAKAAGAGGAAAGGTANEAGKGGTGAAGSSASGTGESETVVVPVGTVIKPEEITDNSVSIDDVVYRYDKNGNAVDDKGAVVYTAQMLADLESEFTIDTVAQSSPYKITIDGQPRQYENSAAGLLQREKDVAEYVAAQTRQTTLNEFFSQNPQLQHVYQYLSEHKSLDGYTPSVDYSKFVLDQNNTDQLKAVISEGERRLGRSPEDIKDLIDYYEKSNKLFEVATRHKDTIVANEAKALAAQQEAQAAQQAKQQENLNKFLGVTTDEQGNLKSLNVPGSLYNVIVEQSKVGGTDIPKDGIAYTENGVVKKITPTDVFNAITMSADAAGNTKFNLMLNEVMQNPEKLANLAFLLMRGTQVSHLVKSAAAQANVVKTITTKVGSGKTVNRGTQSTQQRVSPVANGMHVGIMLED